MSETLIFDISSLDSCETGSREFFTFDGPIDFDDINSRSGITGRMEIMRVENGFNAKAMNVILKIEFICSRCLKKFSYELIVPSFERIFWIEKPEKSTDPNDLFCVNKKALELDANEMFRQEIILHFPEKPVCSKSCHGLLEKYGSEEEVDYKPLAALKDLLKNSHGKTRRTKAKKD